MDLDFLDMLEYNIFPNIKIRGSYGSTTVLSGTVQRNRENNNGDVIFDSFSPYVFYRVVDTNSKMLVPYGCEGNVVMNYISKYGLVPNSIERDLAKRVLGVAQAGDALANIHPLEIVDGKKIIEGVY